MDRRCRWNLQRSESLTRSSRRWEMEGFSFSEMPVVSTHPDNKQFHHLHYNQLPVIHEQFSLLAMRAQKRQPFHVYTDGSCIHPAHETTRYSMLPMLVSSTLQKVTTNGGSKPKSIPGHRCHARILGSLFRCQGQWGAEQTVNGAELSALVTAAQIARM